MYCCSTQHKNTKSDLFVEHFKEGYNRGCLFEVRTVSAEKGLIYILTQI